jgi:hypothetical protein
MHLNLRWKYLSASQPTASPPPIAARVDTKENQPVWLSV